MGDWWTSLSGIEQIYWGFALGGTLFFLVSLLLALIGGDTDIDTDLDAGIGFQFLSLKSVSAFFMLFGWSGLACIQSGMERASVLTISLVCGLIMMTLMALIMYFLRRMAASGNLIMRNAIGCIGEVYLTIPPSRNGIGQVQIQIQGALRTLEAMSENDEPLPSGSIIEVVDIINDQILLVTKK